MTFISQGKSAVESKTVILAGLTAALAALNSLTESVTDPVWLSRIAAAYALINLVLRFYTKDPITGVKKP